MTNLSELREKAERATKGDLKTLRVGDDPRNYLAVATADNISVLTLAWEFETPFAAFYDDADAEFYVAAQPQVVIGMIDELAAKDRRIQALEKAIDRFLERWDEHGRETMGVFEGVSYWSPAGRMVDTQDVVDLRLARSTLTGEKK